jgi:hypothetical protein
MVALDGNAIGGLLHEVFGTDMTDAEATCATCGAAGPVAEAVVYLIGGQWSAAGTAQVCSWSSRRSGA